jgi:Na+-transporting methylmalonyl-CoA/oxaloacetate decarboxylase beta subunit
VRARMLEGGIMVTTPACLLLLGCAAHLGVFMGVHCRFHAFEGRV